ncbi:MAG: trypsin-like serine protease [Candidatus Nucleicultricaceae bacterium]|jgi:hypothetical protein
MFFRISPLVTLLLTSHLYAVTPLRLADNLDSMERAKNIPGLARIGIQLESRDALLGSAVFLSVASLGLSSDYDGRVFASARHIFINEQRKISEKFKKTLANNNRTYDLNAIVEKYMSTRFYVQFNDVSGDRQKHTIQSLYYPKNAEENDDNDIIFGILSSPVALSSYPSFTSINADDLLHQTIHLAGFGYTEINSVLFSDNLARVGEQKIAEKTGKHCFIARPEKACSGEDELPAYSEKGDSGGPVFIHEKDGNLSLAGIMVSVVTPYALDEANLVLANFSSTKEKSLRAHHKELKTTASKTAPLQSRIMHSIKKKCKTLSHTIKEYFGASWATDFLNKISTPTEPNRHNGTVFISIQSHVQPFVDFMKKRETIEEKAAPFSIVAYPQNPLLTSETSQG